jgi:hypothetical protein
MKAGTEKWLHEGLLWRNGYMKAGTEKLLHEGLVWRNGYVKGWNGEMVT